MKKLLIGLVLITPLAACTATERGAAIGGGGGALIGAAVASPGREAEGALVGGAIGAVAGALVARRKPSLAVEQACAYSPASPGAPQGRRR
jgi:hypothetical protein